MENQGGFTDLDFKSGTIPFQINTGAFGPNDVGAQYRHDNVAPGVDAIAELVAIDAVTVNSLTEFPGRGPMLGGWIVDEFGGFFEWEVTLVDAGTTTPAAPINIILTAFDIDGVVGDNTEKDFVVFYDHDGYFSNNPRQVDVNPTGGDVEFIASVAGVADNSSVDPEFTGGAVYTNTNTFRFRGGLTDPQTDPGRLVELSGLFSEISLFTQLDCVEP